MPKSDIGAVLRRNTPTKSQLARAKRKGFVFGNMSNKLMADQVDQVDKMLFSEKKKKKKKSPVAAALGAYK